MLCHQDKSMRLRSKPLDFKSYYFKVFIEAFFKFCFDYKCKMYKIFKLVFSENFSKIAIEIQSL